MMHLVDAMKYLKTGSAIQLFPGISGLGKSLLTTQVINMHENNDIQEGTDIIDKASKGDFSPSERNARGEQYREAIVTFIDILGFKNILSSKSVDEVKNIIRLFHGQYTQNSLSNHTSGFGKKYRVETYIFSDSVVRIKYVDAEDGEWVNTASDEIISLGVMQLELLRHNILVRGGCVKGMIYSDPSSNVLFGPALVEAYKLECDAAIYPRIVVEWKVVKDFHRDMTTSEHWMKADGCANRGISFLKMISPTYSVKGWIGKTKQKNLMFNLPKKPSFFVNYLWGPATSIILGLSKLKFSESLLTDKTMLKKKEIKIANSIEEYLALLTHYGELLESEIIDERVKEKYAWVHFYLHETIKDISEWLEGFDYSYILSNKTLERLVNQAKFFWEKYGCSSKEDWLSSYTPRRLK